ncbi:DMT family transporter [Loktanella sp. F6476L]|uniref:DMT family transporter n=1 Tax=Loktanella sp. F6476L TaxID=2926405 RepID=UPI001FF1489C|nr:DMT family transporter [Loktanella sp. F6476L]MCK0119879.1 DMT family transporter [Loktanella sp. F6476L]
MIKQQTMSARAWIELCLLSLIWGASFLSIRIALDEIGPLTAVAHRTVWAMLVLWIVVYFKGFAVPRDPRVWFAFLIMGLLNNVIPFSLMAWGQLHIETGLASILNAATAVFGVLAASMFFSDEKLTLRRGIGVTVGFFGVATAIGLDAFLSFDLRSLGQLAVIGGTISYALAGVWAKKRLVGLSPHVAAAGMLTGSSVIILPLALIYEGPIRFDLQPVTWAAIGYYALIATALAYLLYYRVLKMAGAGNLMLCTLLVAPVAIILGAIVLGEELPIRSYFGFAILAAGLIILDGRLLQRRKDRTSCP